jgi:hypothetical protein
MKALGLILLLTVATAASDVSGKWTGNFAVPGSDHKEPQFFILTQDGSKLTGSGGPDSAEQYPITDGSVDGETVRFQLATDSWAFQYDLKRNGQEMTGELLLKNKDGDSRTAQVKLKKAVEAAGARMGQADSQDAIPAIVHAFDSFPIVALGERHSLKAAGAFYLSLLKDSRFQNRVNCIVIEFGSRLSQPIIDRYINGDAVPRPELQSVWRNTTKVFAFESPIYAQLLEAVRDVNAGLPRERRMRVLAGDAPIDWASVTTHEQWESYQPNDASFAEVIDEQVLAPGRKALVILGGSHVNKSRDADEDANTTTLVERKHPGVIYVVLLAPSKPATLATLNAPALIPTPHAPDHGVYGDALLYLGENMSSADPDWQQYSADPGYMRELDRRARIEWGCGFDLQRFIKGLLPCA